jgi:hypothetical protein
MPQRKRAESHPRNSHHDRMEIPSKMSKRQLPTRGGVTEAARNVIMRIADRVHGWQSDLGLEARFPRLVSYLLAKDEPW